MRRGRSLEIQEKVERRVADFLCELIGHGDQVREAIGAAVSR
jgi:hypothetical protein